MPPRSARKRFIELDDDDFGQQRRRKRSETKTTAKAAPEETTAAPPAAAEASPGNAAWDTSSSSSPAAAGLPRLANRPNFAEAAKGEWRQKLSIQASNPTDFNENRKIN